MMVVHDITSPFAPFVYVDVILLQENINLSIKSMKKNLITLLLAFAAMAGGAAIAAGYFAFISMIGIFPKLLSKIQYNRHYMLVENVMQK